MGTAIIGIIQIFGVIGGISGTVDIYTPQYSENEQIHQDIYDYFQKVSNINDIKSHNSTVVNIADTIIQNAMEFVMIVTSILMGVVFILTFRLNDKKIKK